MWCLWCSTLFLSVVIESVVYGIYYTLNLSLKIIKMLRSNAAPEMQCTEQMVRNLYVVFECS